MERKTYNLLIGGSGSSSIRFRLPDLLKYLLELNSTQERYFFKITLILTEQAKSFCKLCELPSEVTVYDDATWRGWRQKGDRVMHIELRDWADVMLIAPLTANTLAKIANGICDNLLTAVVRAWNMKKPFIFCPAMNSLMWEHPVTAKHVATLKEWGFLEMHPVVKMSLTGKNGIGGMDEDKAIVEKVIEALEGKK